MKKHLLLRPDATKIEVLEEFLHGQQQNIGIDMTGANYPGFELSVKDFMIRHQSMPGISPEDASILQQMMNNYPK